MEKRLRAKVNQVITPSNNYLETIIDDELVPVERLPEPAWLEILETTDGDCFVFYLDTEFRCFADSWHQTIDDAKLEGSQAFGITEAEWQELGPT